MKYRIVCSLSRVFCQIVVESSVRTHAAVENALIWRRGRSVVRDMAAPLPLCSALYRYIQQRCQNLARRPLIEHKRLTLARRRQNELAIWLQGPAERGAWIRSRVVASVRPSTLVLLCELQGLAQLAQNPLRVTFIIMAIAPGRRWAIETHTQRERVELA